MLSNESVIDIDQLALCLNVNYQTDEQRKANVSLLSTVIN